MATVRAIETASLTVERKQEMLDALEELKTDIEEGGVQCLALMWVNKENESIAHIMPHSRFTLMVGVLQTALFDLLHGAYE